MDTSDTMDSLDDSSTLPELSFDDLLDPSPVKKSNSSSFDEDGFDDDDEQNNLTDDTLNTPCHKKPLVIQKNIIVGASTGMKMATPIRSQAVKLKNNPTTFTNIIKNDSGSPSAPILLNSKNILPKPSAQILNNSIKFTQKVAGGNGNTTNLPISGKTAVRTSNGQIIYIQKTPASTNMKGSSVTNIVKSQNITGTNSKPVTIQVLRTADGSYVPLKSTTTGTNVKTTLTLSPTSLAGKKIISSAGGQVIIKGTIKPTDSTVPVSTAKTITTNAITGVKTVVKPITSSSLASSQLNDLNKSKPIVVHATSGKQIIVSNQNIVKLSPKAPTITTTAGITAVSTSTTGSGQIHAIQIPGKIGVQYVRVLPNTKVAAKTSNTSSASAITSIATESSTKTLTAPSQLVKTMNALPQKFTVLQKGIATKVVVTHKKDMPNNNNNTEFSPTTSKVQKTLVTVPTIKSINDDKNKRPHHQLLQQSLIKPTQHSLLSNNTSANQSQVRKHKISEINSEIQRITTKDDKGGPPEIKKPAPNNRIVVVSNSSQSKILNNTIQQPGRLATSVAVSSHTSTASKTVAGSVMRTVNITQNGKKLYTVLKPSDQKLNPELYTVLKTINQTTSTTTTATSKNIVKPLINKQQLMQQQHKLLQLKQQNQQQTISTLNKNSLNAPGTSVLPIKIKDEPSDATSHVSNAAEGTSTQANLPTSMAEEDAESLDPLVGGVRRKHCNCSKSQCLKLYCDCFANGEFCQDCTCKDCCNNLENEDERQRAIKACLERNPNAFKPKITSSREQADMRLHNKGCNCKRSGCLKNYCECYEAKIPCSSNCKCVGCRNVEDRPDLDMDPVDPKIMDAIVMGVSNDNLSLKRNYEKAQRDFSGAGNNTKTEKISKEPIKSLSSYDTMCGTISPTLERQQSNFITQEVIDATVQCMITQADECEQNNLPAYQTEKMVMEELGRCLVEIIDFSIQNTDNSYSQK